MKKSRSFREAHIKILYLKGICVQPLMQSLNISANIKGSTQESHFPAQKADLGRWDKKEHGRTHKEKESKLD